jgi:hypothetical protein
LEESGPDHGRVCSWQIPAGTGRRLSIAVRVKEDTEVVMDVAGPAGDMRFRVSC